jgi:hypothetical protein
VVHDLPVAFADLVDEVVERNVVQNRTDGGIDILPDRAKLVRGVPSRSVIRSGMLHERTAYALDDVADRDLRRGPGQHVPADGSTLASNDVDAFQDLHDLEKELDGDGLALGDIVDADRKVGIVAQGQVENRETRLLVFRRYFHAGSL